MDKRDYVIIGLLVVIIAMLSYGVYNSYMDSQPEVFDFGNYKLTGPAGSHHHSDINGSSFYLGENDSVPILVISDLGSSGNGGQNFNEMVNAYNSGEVSKSEILESFNENMNSEDGNMKALDFNVGDFRGEPEISVLCQSPYDGTKTVLMHIILHNNDKGFVVMEFMDNPASTQMYNSLQLK